MDIAEFIRKHKDDVIEEQQKHIFWNDLTEALGSVYKLKTEYNKIDFFVPGLVLIEHKTRGKLDVKTNGKNAIDQAMLTIIDTFPKNLTSKSAVTA
jgi:hypothetical protein